MMTTLKRLASAIAAIPTYGSFVYDSFDGKPKFIDENGVVSTLAPDGLRDQNLIINGGLDFAQRQTPSTLATYSQTAARIYSADRFAVTNENTSVQYQRTDTSTSPQTGITARYYGTWSKITTTGKIVVSQILENVQCMHLRGRKVRVQLKMKASAAKNIRVALMQLTNLGTVDQVPGFASGLPSGTFVSAFGANATDPTFGASLSKINPDTADNASIANSGLTCSVTTAFQRFGGSFTLPSNFVNLVLVVFTDSQFVAADSFSLTEVGLYDGTEIRDWAPRLWRAELNNCQRYYCKSFNVEAIPAQNAGLSGASRGYVSVAAAVAGQPIGVRFPVPMRAGTANLVFFNPSAVNAFVRNTTAASDATVTGTSSTGEEGFDCSFTGNAAWTIAQALAVHWTCENEL